MANRHASIGIGGVRYQYSLLLLRLPSLVTPPGVTSAVTGEYGYTTNNHMVAVGSRHYERRDWHGSHRLIGYGRSLVNGILFGGYHTLV